MKIIDRTPFYKDGQLNLIDRVKAMLQFGTGWIKEIEAQKSVLAVMERLLDKNYTVLRNITPPGLDATIPIILVGPTGVFVMSASPLVGMYRAKGDQWGSISGTQFKPEKPNLMTRIERMARVVQVFLQRQSYADLPNVEAILLFSDPSVHIDSLRPIVRVVMRDALERFLVSLTQGRVVLSPEGVFDLVNRLTNSAAGAATESAPAEEPAAVPVEAMEQPEDQPFLSTFPFDQPQSSAPYESTAVESPFTSERYAEPMPAASPPVSSRMRPSRRGLNGKQWAVLIAMFAVWCLIVAVFIVLALYPSLLP